MVTCKRELLALDARLADSRIERDARPRFEPQLFQAMDGFRFVYLSPS